MGRKCAVPHCYTGYRKCPDKASLYKVPDDDFFLSRWQEAIAREDRPITPKDYVCEKHFKEDDILRRRIRKDVLETYQRPKLKPDAIPSIFPDLPEFILKMTKKRRKITEETVPNKVIVITMDDDEDKACDVKTEPEIGINLENENTVETGINNDEINIKTEIDDIPPPIEETIEEFDSSGAKLYHCDECSYKTKFSHNLRTHQVKHLSGEDAFMSCELCINYKTKWEITYLNHMKSKHGIVLKEVLKCPFCLFRTRNKSFLSKHCDREHDKGEGLENKLKCEHEGCEYQTESKALLNIHSLTHDKPNPRETKKVKVFTCRECYFSSNSKGSLATHVKHVHNVGSHTEPIKKSAKASTEPINKTFKASTKPIKRASNASTEPTNKALKASTKPIKRSSKVGGGAIKSTTKGSIEPIKRLSKDNTNSTKVLSKGRTKDTSGLTRGLKGSKVSVKMLKSIQSKAGKPSFKCSRCPYKSHSQSLLEKHLIKHQMTFTKTLLYCAKCSYTTVSEVCLENHQKDTFHCVECPYTSADKSDYIKHTLTHRNTSVEIVNRYGLESARERGFEEMFTSVQDFCMVTIKEEHEDL